MPIRLPVLLLPAVLAVIVLFNWQVGAPVTMPASPLAAGEKIPCVSYAPFRRGQSPFTEDIVISAAQIDEDFAHLSKVTECVRTYAVDQGLENVPVLAKKHGLKVILGIWLGREAPKNALQIEAGVKLANRYPDVIRLLVIGNEALLRGEISEKDLGGILKSVKARVKVPTTYADVWEFWERHKGLADFVDTVTVHILPYWEDAPVPAGQAGKHVADIRKHVGEVFAGKPILIGETGWPSEGRMRWGARATPADQAQVLHDLLELKKSSGYDVNLIEAFDQPWKRLLEGTVGGYWGLLDADTREPKFHWGEAVSNYPKWKEQAVLGAALALMMFASAYVAGRGRTIEAKSWIAVAVTAAVAGCTIGLAVHMHAIGARTPFELGRAAVYLVLAAASPVIAAAALVQGTAPISFARLMGRPARIKGLETWLAALLAGITVLSVYLALGLVFDPRYREFATSTLIGPVTGFLMLALLARRTGSVFSERIFAAVLTMSSIVIVVQEKLSNWEALLFAALLLILAGTLVLARAGQEQAAEVPAPAR
ncbi:beta-1,6-glucan synthase [Terrihabitans soli]|uniref:Endo-1,3-beta-glucanase btgC n=1 Tax=Terrihabitans soli TaxID=708113 RepID=A0A6S6QNE9_9HYPH|nr:beta-1,6-glucan synthase [Terrihabitans soli]BCJ90936.1 beta-1,6-glucan synthase [Terrihabitans soli]